MVKVFANKHRTFLLTADDGTTMIVHPSLIQEIPDKFTGDITYKRAIAAGDLQLFETVKQGEALEKKANESANDAKQNKKDGKPSGKDGGKAGDEE